MRSSVASGNTLEDSYREALDAPFAIDARLRRGGRLIELKNIEKGHTAIYSTIYKDQVITVGTVQSIRFLRPARRMAHIELESGIQRWTARRQRVAQ